MSEYSFTVDGGIISPVEPPGSGVGSGPPSSAAVSGSLTLWDLRFDPITQDLVDDGLGGFQLASGAQTSVLHQMFCHYAEWWADASLGSRIHDADAFITDPPGLVRLETQRALGELVADGAITKLTVRSTETSLGRVDTDVSYTDTLAGTVNATTITAAGA